MSIEYRPRELLWISKILIFEKYVVTASERNMW